MRPSAHFIILLGFFIRLMVWMDGGTGSLVPETYLHPSGATPQDTLLANELAKRSVYHNDFFKTVLYTWTTKTQIDLLRTNKVLLTKSKSETKGYSIYDVSLRDTILYNNPYAKLLREDRFSKKRFAWP